MQKETKENLSLFIAASALLIFLVISVMYYINWKPTLKYAEIIINKPCTQASIDEVRPTLNNISTDDTVQFSCSSLPTQDSMKNRFTPSADKKLVATITTILNNSQLSMRLNRNNIPVHSIVCHTLSLGSPITSCTGS